MNAIEIDVLELVEMAETPLYSAYRWLGREMGAELSVGGFLDLIQSLIDRNAVRLWLTDVDAQQRRELAAVPAGLAKRYSAIPDLDPAFDPFDLTLTLGRAIEKREPEWEVDADFSAGTFMLSALPGSVPAAFEQMSRLYDSTDFVERQRSLQGGRVRVEGILVNLPLK